MKLRYSGLVCLLLAIGCGGDDDGGGAADAGTADAGGDVDAAAPDAAPEPDLSAGEIADLCERLCGSAADCDELASVGGEDCLATCEDALEADPGYIATVTCANTVECDSFATCLEDIPIDPACVELCGPVVECGYDSLLDLADPLLCEETCSGALHAGTEDVTGLIGCYGDALADGCNFFGVVDCNPGSGEGEISVPPCLDLCEPIGACTDDTNAGADFADADACNTYCDGLTSGQRAEFAVCTILGGCDAASCNEIPDEPPAACKTGCATLADTCDAENGYAAEVCSHKCSGLHHIPEDHSLTGFTACDATLTECPQPTDANMFGPLSDVYDVGLQYCLLQPSMACQTVCADAVACGVTDSTTYQCEIDCAIQENDGSDVPATQAACLDGIDRSQTQEEICTDVGACLGT